MRWLDGIDRSMTGRSPLKPRLYVCPLCGRSRWSAIGPLTCRRHPVPHAPAGPVTGRPLRDGREQSRVAACARGVVDAATALPR